MQAGTKLGRLRMRTQAHPTPELSPFSPEHPSLHPSGPASSASPHASLTVGDASALAIGVGLAVGARGADERPALNGSCSAGAVQGAVTGEPGFPCLWKPQEDPGNEERSTSSPSSPPSPPFSPSLQSEWLSGLRPGAVTEPSSHVCLCTTP